MKILRDEAIKEAIALERKAKKEFCYRNSTRLTQRERDKAVAQAQHKDTLRQVVDWLECRLVFTGNMRVEFEMPEEDWQEFKEEGKKNE